MPEHFDNTIAAYDARADDYIKLTKTDDNPPELAAFSAALPKGGRVLDLGCGPGFAASRLAHSGFQVDAVDASTEMVALAKMHPGVTAWQARFDEIGDTARYDGIWANFSLLHAPRAEFPAHLARLKQAGKPDVILHLGMKLGSGEGPDSLGRFYAYYNEEELVTLIESAGFTVVTREHGESPGMVGNVEPWILVLAHG